MSTNWDVRMLEAAKYFAQWSKDPSTKVGAVIADKNNIIKGIGYNGFPRGVEDLPERYDNREFKYKLVVHAELNAILNANSSVENCKIYVWPTLMIPACCPECAKAIIQSGIKTIVMYDSYTLTDRWQDLSRYSSIMLTEAGIEIRIVPLPVETN